MIIYRVFVECLEVIYVFYINILYLIIMIYYKEDIFIYREVGRDGISFLKF